MAPVMSNFSGNEFKPSRDEVARSAYFTYLNQGSLHGHDVEHWLAAEAELVAERKLAGVHGYHHPVPPRSQTTHEKPVIL